MVLMVTLFVSDIHSRPSEDRPLKLIVRVTELLLIKWCLLVYFGRQKSAEVFIYIVHVDNL